MISDKELDELFDLFLSNPELASWESDLSGREREDAKRLFRIVVRKSIDIDRNGRG